MASSDAAGRILLPDDVLGDGLHVALVRAGFETVLLTGFVRGEIREVAMHRAHDLHVRVVTEDGRPVAGFDVWIARAAPPREPGFGEVVSSSGLRIREAGGGVFWGKSNEAGFLVLRGAAAGRYFLQCNRSGLPYSVFDPPIVVSVPSAPITITVKELWAAAIVFSGDEVVAINRPYLGAKSMLRSPGSQTEKVMFETCHARLRQRFPGSRTLVGLPRRVAEDTRSGLLMVYGRRGGWSTCRVKIRPWSEVHEAEVVPLPGGDRDMTARVHVVATDERDEIIELPQCGVLLEYQHGVGREFLTGVRSAFGEECLVPAGAVTIHTGGRLCRGAFEPIAMTLTAGAREAVRIPLPDVKGYRVAVRLLDGCFADRFGLSVEIPGGPLFPCLETNYLFYSTADRIPYRAYVQGYQHAEGVFEFQPVTTGGARVQDFTVQMSELRLLP